MAAQDPVGCKRSLQYRPKLKSGCKTCRSVRTCLFENQRQLFTLTLRDRIRRIKCDERKPACKKCVNTGRTCDGYESPFRPCVVQFGIDNHTRGVRRAVGKQPVWSTWTGATPLDVDLLSRCFSTKTIFNVDLGCEEEARDILLASTSSLHIRHAVSSLRALRQNFDSFGHAQATEAQQTQTYVYGLREYCDAMAGLSGRLSYPGLHEVRSALLCCQIFISIEQIRGNWAAVIQHVIRGLGIMREYRARPELVAGTQLVSALDPQLPLVDVFIVKLFAAPCKFSESPGKASASGSTPSLTLPQEQPNEHQQLRPLAPDVRAQLTRIATSTLEYLRTTSQVRSVANALPLRSTKLGLLAALESWLAGLETIQSTSHLPEAEPLSTSFLRIFHRILRVIVLGTLECSPNMHADLRIEHSRLQTLAAEVGERVKHYYLL
jgi:hypothetical protein